MLYRNLPVLKAICGRQSTTSNCNNNELIHSCAKEYLFYKEPSPSSIIANNNNRNEMDNKSSQDAHCCTHDHSHSHNHSDPSLSPSFEENELTRSLQSNQPLLRYVHEASRDPNHLYQLLTEHPEIVSKDNFVILHSIVKNQLREELPKSNATTTDNNNTEPSNDSTSTPARSIGSESLSIAKFFYFKLIVLKMCLEVGTERFFEETLCSDPPGKMVQLYKHYLDTQINFCYDI